MNALKQLEACGQSPWLDYLKRSLIEKGELGTLIEHDGLKGVTSNPSIFEKAIGESDEYAEPMEQFQARGDHGVSALYEHLAVADIRAAADVLRPVYDADEGQGRLCQPGMLALPRQRHRGHGRGGAAALEGGRASQPDGEGAGDAGGHSRDPPPDRRRAQHQHHAAVLPSRSTSRWPRPISPGLSELKRRRAAMSPRSAASPASSSAASTPRSTSAWTSSPTGARRSGSAARSRSPTPRSPTAATRRCSPGPRWELLAAIGRDDAAPALGLHQHQEPGLQGHDLCRGADRPRHRQHHAAGDHGCVPRPRRGDPRRDRARRGGRAAAACRAGDAGHLAQGGHGGAGGRGRAAVRGRLRQAARRRRSPPPRPAGRRPRQAGGPPRIARHEGRDRGRDGGLAQGRAHPAAVVRRQVAVDRRG